MRIGLEISRLLGWGGHFFGHSGVEGAHGADDVPVAECPCPKCGGELVGDTIHHPYSPGVIKMCFLGSRLYEVTITGRNLWRLYDLLYQSRMRWVMAAAPGRDFGKDGEAFVSSVTIREVNERG